MANDAKGVFISYRRDETAGYAGWLSDALIERFGEDRVFRDVDSIEPGLDFAEAIERAIEASEIVLVLIGRSWLTATDANGRQRLQNPHDYVRMEVAAALQRDIRVVPLLVQGASMPYPEELPDDLVPLTRRNAFPMSDASWRYETRHLIDRLERVAGGRERPLRRRPGEGSPGRHLIDRLERVAGHPPGEGSPGEGSPGERSPREGSPGEGSPGEGSPGEGQPRRDPTGGDTTGRIQVGPVIQNGVKILGWIVLAMILLIVLARLL